MEKQIFKLDPAQFSTLIRALSPRKVVDPAEAIVPCKFDQCNGGGVLELSCSTQENKVLKIMCGCRI